MSDEVIEFDLTLRTAMVVDVNVSTNYAVDCKISTGIDEILNITTIVLTETEL